MPIHHLLAAIALAVSLILPLGAAPEPAQEPGAGFAMDAAQWTRDYAGEAAFTRSMGAGEDTHFYEATVDGAFLRVYTEPNSETIRYVYLWSVPESGKMDAERLPGKQLMRRSATPTPAPAREDIAEAFIAQALPCVRASVPGLPEDDLSAYADEMRGALLGGGELATLEGGGVQCLTGLFADMWGRESLSLVITPAPDARMDGLSPSYFAWQTALLRTLAAQGQPFVTWNDPVVSAMNDDSRGRMLINVIPGIGSYVAAYTDMDAPYFVRGFDVSATATVTDVTEALSAGLEDGWALFAALAMQADPAISPGDVDATGAALMAALESIAAGEATVLADGLPAYPGGPMLSLTISVSESYEPGSLYVFAQLSFQYP